MHLLATAIGILTLSSLAHAQDRVQLDNGATIIVHAIPDVDWVGVESIYDVGFVHEPRDMTQAAHLAEHLMCMAAMGDFDRDEAFEALNAKGLANAETLASFTHYDATVPADQLQTVFDVEAARLAGIRIDAAIIEHEGARCHAEVMNVQRSPRAPMYKFAIMAANQAWRHDQDVAHVAAGLETIDAEAMRRFCNDHYEPSRLTLIIVGDVDAQATFDLARRTIGAVPRRRDAEALSPLALRSRTLQWDSSIRAAIVGAAPPDDPAARLILTLWGDMLSMRLQQADQSPRGVTIALACGRTAPVGPLPLFVYATIERNADQQAVAERLSTWLTRQAGAAPADAAQIRSLAASFTMPISLGKAVVDVQSRQLVAMGRDADTATGLVLTNTALQLGVREHLLNLYTPDAFEQVASMSDDEIALAIQDALAPDRRFTTTLVPLQ